MTIFLDIDGVLNRHVLLENSYNRMEPECIGNFNELLKQLPDVRIVLHSSWRYLNTPDCMTMLGVENLLLTHGLLVEGKIKERTEFDEETAKRQGLSVRDKTAWRTWITSEGVNVRRAQIQEFVKVNNITNFVVLDDIDLDMPEQIKVDGHEGLTLLQAKEAFYGLKAGSHEKQEER